MAKTKTTGKPTPSAERAEAPATQRAKAKAKGKGKGAGKRKDKLAKADRAGKAGRRAKATRAAQGVAAPHHELVAIDGVAIDRPTRAERRASGEALREQVPYEALGEWRGAPGRDPVAVIEATNQGRLADLVPIRHGRMLVSPFTYYRGAPAVMAADLATMATTGLTAQICGDAHLLNFGMFASPERSLLFDVNDFDETLPGPWEWDVARLAASMVIAGRARGFPNRVCRTLAEEAARSYAAATAAYAGMSALDVWYSRVDIDQVRATIEQAPTDEAHELRRVVDAGMQRAMRKTSAEAMPKLTAVVDGRRRIVDDPPLIVHLSLDDQEIGHIVEHVFAAYRATLEPERRVLLDRFVVVDVARKVVGVGSVGTRCYVILLVSTDGEYPLFLQVKEAVTSVLEPHCRPSRYRHQGERVVVGQRLMQAASDIFLGWTKGPAGAHFYVRQLRDMKGSARVDRFTPAQLQAYGRICGWTLARAHARSGDVAMLAGYLGDGADFATQMGRFSLRYADQNDHDYEAFAAAAADGRIEVISGR